MITHSEFRKVSLKEIAIPDPIRRAINEAGIRELAEDLKQRGLLEPIVVRMDGKTPVLIAGLRRLKAAESLGWTEIEAHVVDVTEADGRAAQLAENVKREDLNPLDHANAIAAYIDVRKKAEPEIKLETIAKELQISPSEISNNLRILKAPPGVQKLIDQGRISPGHVEHVLAPLEEKLSSDELVKFAHEIARQNLPIVTAKEEAKDVLRQHEANLAREKLAGIVKASKVKRCPTCKDRTYGGEPASYMQVNDRTILADSNATYDVGHRWDAETGELYYTPAEKRRVTEDEKARTQARKIAAEARKKAGKIAREKIDREYAVFFSRADLDAWARALLEASIEKGVMKLQVDTRRWGGIRDDLDTGLDVSGKGLGLPGPISITRVDLPDGKKGKFATRVQVGTWSAASSTIDNVGEAAASKEVAKARETLLEFQRERAKVKQDAGDLWPIELDGFKIGEKVRLGEKAGWGSYVGKQGVILAFDLLDALHGDTSRVSAKTAPVVVLDVAAAHKIHWLSSVEHLPTKPVEKGKAPTKPKKKR